jgi:hypothetical protein
MHPIETETFGSPRSNGQCTMLDSCCGCTRTVYPFLHTRASEREGDSEAEGRLVGRSFMLLRLLRRMPRRSSLVRESISVTTK